MLCYHFNLSVLPCAVFYIPIVTFEEEIDDQGPHLKNLVVKIIEGNVFRRDLFTVMKLAHL